MEVTLERQSLAYASNDGGKKIKFEIPKIHTYSKNQKFHWSLIINIFQYFECFTVQERGTFGFRIVGGTEEGKLHIICGNTWL